MRLRDFLVWVIPCAGSNRRPNTILGSNGDTSGRRYVFGIRFKYVCFTKLILGKASEENSRTVIFSLKGRLKKMKSKATSTLSD